MKEPIKQANLNRYISILGIFILLTITNGLSPIAGIDDAWESVASMPYPRSRHAAVVVDGKIYVLGGWDRKSEDLATVVMYDPSNNSWHNRANMPTARYNLGAATVNGKIYALGGLYYEGKSKSWQDYAPVDEYNPTTDTWQRRSTMPTPRCGLAVVEVDGRIYAIGGGAEGISPHNSGRIVEEYNPVTNTWRRRANIPTPRLNFAAAVVNGKIYVIGGRTFDAESHCFTIATVEEYNPVTNIWRRRADMPTTRFNLAVAVVGGRFYAIGGETCSQCHDLATVEEYDPDSDTWINRTPISIERNYLATVTVGGQIYAIGGWHGQRIAIMEKYDPPFYDTDEDGLADDDELGHYFTDPFVQDTDTDTDGDNLSNVEEVDIYGTSPTTKDSDGDDLHDGEEVNIYESNPIVTDTDGDQLFDGIEVKQYETDPISADTDGDGLYDGEEVMVHETNPLSADTDGDLFLDGEEVIRGFDPNNSEDYPPLSILPSNELENKPPSSLIPGFNLVELVIALICLFLIARWRR